MKGQAAGKYVEERPSRRYGLDDEGFEHPDPRPVEMPTRLKLPQRQVDRVRELVRREMSEAARREGMESFEEADDFELEDEEWISPYEEVFEPMNASEDAPPVGKPTAPGNTSLPSKPGTGDNAANAQSPTAAGGTKTGSAEPVS